MYETQINTNTPIYGIPGHGSVVLGRAAWPRDCRYEESLGFHLLLVLLPVSYHRIVDTSSPKWKADLFTRTGQKKVNMVHLMCRDEFGTHPAYQSKDKLLQHVRVVWSASSRVGPEEMGDEGVSNMEVASL